jgi:hypothetical protein
MRKGMKMSVVVQQRVQIIWYKPNIKRVQRKRIIDFPIYGYSNDDTLKIESVEIEIYRCLSCGSECEEHCPLCGPHCFYEPVLKKYR